MVEKFQGEVFGLLTHVEMNWKYFFIYIGLRYGSVLIHTTWSKYSSWLMGLRQG